MLRPLVATAVAVLVSASSAFALDLPARRPGLWEIKMEFVGRDMPAQAMTQCIDAASDKLMNSGFGGTPQEACTRHDVSRSGATMTVDSVCTFNGVTGTTHAVVDGSFDSAYTVDVLSKREGGRAIPGMPANGESHMKISARWLGPCAAGQKPGDVVMANGWRMNMLDMQRAREHMPPRP